MPKDLPTLVAWLLLAESMENGDETDCPVFPAVGRHLPLRARAELKWNRWIIRRH